jgi:2-polyprenyl-6-methoxyphenol hydroxylase-like FAD-dependent oxidoreductase
VISPSAPACLAQDELEPLLLAHLRSLGPDRVALGTEVVDVATDGEGVRAVLRDLRTGATRVVQAEYLIAADGAHSAVRRALRIPMCGPDRLAQAVSALFRAPLWELLGAHRHGIYFVTDPVGHGTFLPAGRGDRWLYGVIFEPGTQRVEDYTPERFARLIRAGAGAPDLVPRIERTGAFMFAAQLADRFRHGAAFLIGDAAHRVAPRGGTGLNTAFRDGHDLGWKLAWVLRGWAGPDLLDSYEAERRPVAEHNVARSADPQGSVREPAEELHADLGGRLPHVWLQSAGRRVSTLDLLGPGLTLLTGPGDDAWRRAAAGIAGPVPLAVRELSAVTARALGIRGGGALLARPDGTPAGWWPHAVEPGSALRAAVGAALTGAAAGRRAAA